MYVILRNHERTECIRIIRTYFKCTHRHNRRTQTRSAFVEHTEDRRTIDRNGKTYSFAIYVTAPTHGENGIKTIFHLHGSTERHLSKFVYFLPEVNALRAVAVSVLGHTERVELMCTTRIAHCQHNWRQVTGTFSHCWDYILYIHTHATNIRNVRNIKCELQMNGISSWKSMPNALIHVTGHGEWLYKLNSINKQQRFVIYFLSYTLSYTSCDIWFVYDVVGLLAIRMKNNNKTDHIEQRKLVFRSVKALLYS